MINKLNKNKCIYIVAEVVKSNTVSGQEPLTNRLIPNTSEDAPKISEDVSKTSEDVPKISARFQKTQIFPKLI